MEDPEDWSDDDFYSDDGVEATSRIKEIMGGYCTNINAVKQIDTSDIDNEHFAADNYIKVC